jgi:hypothetical protein
VTAGPGAPRAGRREWIGLGVLALPCLLYAMDLTLGGAVAGQLRGPMGSALAEAARQAFGYGLHVAFAICAVLTLAAAAAAVALLRHPRPPGPAPGPELRPGAGQAARPFPATPGT